MGYRSAGDGRAIKKGKTRVEIYPDDGPKVVDSAKATKGMGLNAKMKAVGRNLARAANQKGGK